MDKQEDEKGQVKFLAHLIDRLLEKSLQRHADKIHNNAIKTRRKNAKSR
mgnify:CR=1 FL=1